MLLPSFSWAADSVEVRIAVVLVKEKDPEADKTLETFPDMHRRWHEQHRKHEARRGVEEGDKLEAEDLQPMQKALARRRHYGWFKRFSKKRATVGAQGEAIELPGGAQATVRLKELKDDIATLVVSLPSTETTYQLGRTGTLYLQAGKHEETEVWVVISPAKHFR